MEEKDQMKSTSNSKREGKLASVTVREEIRRVEEAETRQSGGRD